MSGKHKSLPFRTPTIFLLKKEKRAKKKTKMDNRTTTADNRTPQENAPDRKPRRRQRVLLRLAADPLQTRQPLVEEPRSDRGSTTPPSKKVVVRRWRNWTTADPNEEMEEGYEKLKEILDLDPANRHPPLFWPPVTWADEDKCLHCNQERYPPPY
ncbi:hypothetical protein OUZ56_000266 [Daphnia magna]|uniref:Uncharacterized protein n=1 Tax=Daphnia magna TaxID=35525 RepID=A0ABQ9ZZ63_9CRUS|nr:hypothetical protein OUZ56_000266 [Daphnia magna]